MKSFIRLSGVTIIISLTFFGCAAPITSGAGTSAMTQGDDFSTHLQVDNPELGQRLKIINVKSRKTNDLLEINLQLKSRYKKSLKLQYHFNWFDSQGFVIESRKTPWKPFDLHGFQSTTLKGLAPNNQVASFSVYVRDVPEKAYRY
jgi:uncharacterized protein YcfL